MVGSVSFETSVEVAEARRAALADELLQNERSSAGVYETFAEMRDRGFTARDLKVKRAIESWKKPRRRKVGATSGVAQ